MVKYSGKKATNKKKKNILTGVVHVCATFNNTIVSITDLQGNLICWSSAGKHGFKGSRKATPYAAQVATQHAVTAAKECGLQTVSVVMFGPGVGREASLRALQATDINVTSIVDNTYHPHNGCRPAKRRRV
jgi:small subunit ribosomal protein S11